MKKSTVFEETYNKYLSHISDIDLMSRAVRLGAELAEDSLIIPYYETPVGFNNFLWLIDPPVSVNPNGGEDDYR